MEVLINGQLAKIDKGGVVGAGGEGYVVKMDVPGIGLRAVKMYHAPTVVRGRKLESFLNQKWNLPQNRLALPLELVKDRSGSKVLGFTMPFLGTNFEEIASLSNKKKRTALGANSRLVGNIFLDGHNSLKQIHQSGLVIGDFSELNTLFKGEYMLWIDVDAWQFGSFPCPVATEDFVDPNLYGIDFSKRPIFKPENDWYSFATMLFRSLVLVHPYGGVHPKYNTLTDRAKNKIAVFDPKVKYPKVAISPDILSDDIAQVFNEIFQNGKRGEFPKPVLDNYVKSLVECKSCKSWYPNNRKGCPVCNKRNLVVITKPSVTHKGVSIAQFFKTSGEIVYTKVFGDRVYVIAHESGDAILHIVSESGEQKIMDLGRIEKGIRYVVLENLLVANKQGEQELMLYDISGNTPILVKKTTTEVFAPSRKAVFQDTGNSILRMAGGNIMAMGIGGKHAVERPIRTGLPGLTWFSANSDYHGLQILGLIQILNEQKYWYYLDGQGFEPKVSELEQGEALVDLSVKFSSETTILRRKTQKAGVNYLRQDLIDAKGNVTHSSQIKFENAPVQTLHGQVYSNGVLLHASDGGIVQEKILTGELKTFSQTEPFVGEGDSLQKFGRGLLVVNANSVSYLQLS